VGFSVGIKCNFLISFSNGGQSEQVGLNISLRYIFKPSYSPHCINSNVGSNGVDPTERGRLVYLLLPVRPALTNFNYDIEFKAGCSNGDVSNTGVRLDT
jgi:hypothetical protein